jgi:hypothetical protein
MSFAGNWQMRVGKYNQLIKVYENVKSKPSSITRMKMFQVQQNYGKQNLTRITLGLLFLGSILLIYSGFTIANGVQVFSKEEQPFGVPRDVWLGKYWQWLITQTPAQTEPPDGSCPIHKSGSMVMLFDPSFSGPHNFECDISSKYVIMVPSWNGVYYNAKGDELPDNTPIGELSKLAKVRVDSGAVTSDVMVDGKSVAKLDEITSKDGNYKINTMDNFTEIYAKPFNITVPANTFLPGQNVGTWPSGAHGWFTFLKPLPPGEHKLLHKFSVQGLGADNVASENTYTLHVKSNQTGNTTTNIPSNGTMLNSNVTNKSSLNTTLPEQLPPQSINGSKIPKI